MNTYLKSVDDCFWTLDTSYFICTEISINLTSNINHIKSTKIYAFDQKNANVTTLVISIKTVLEVTQVCCTDNSRVVNV